MVLTTTTFQSCTEGIEAVFLEPTTMRFQHHHRHHDWKPSSSRTLQTSPLSDDNSSIRVIGKASDLPCPRRRRSSRSNNNNQKQAVTENHIQRAPFLTPDAAKAWIQMGTPSSSQPKGPSGFKKTNKKSSQSAMHLLQEMSPPSSSSSHRAMVKSSSWWFSRGSKYKPVGLDEHADPSTRVRRNNSARPRKARPSETASNHHNKKSSQQQQPRGSFPTTTQQETTRRCTIIRRSGMKSFSKKKQQQQQQQSKWKTAVDPKTGRTYYYHSETRATQWDKPLELATKEERIVMERKEQRQREFFATMEANILKNLSQGTTAFGNKNSKADTTTAAALPTDGTQQQQQRTDNNNKTLARPNLVRTISTMEEGVLRDLVQRVPSCHETPVRSSPTDVIDRRLATVQEQQSSLGSLLSDLPQDNNDNSFSTTFSSPLDESIIELDISDEESRALQKLAQITDEMTHVDSEANLQGLDFLSEIDEEGEEDQDSSSPRNKESLLNRDLNSLNLQDDSLQNDEKPTVSRPGMTQSQSQRPIQSNGLQLLEKPPRRLTRRNTCGTLYVGSTMSAPDKDATIKCVCGVYRAHILQSEMEGTIGNDDKYRIFNDLESQQKPGHVFLDKPPAPSLEDVTSFYRDVFGRAQMESDTIIMSLIYVERLIKCTEGALRPTPSNWRSILFSCMVLSSKVWDDLSMWNCDFSQTCPAGVRFPLKRTNELEVAVLSALNYKVKVPASEYAKYYFLLRSMLIKSGLGGDDLKTLNPLDVEGAKRLQQVSTQYQTKTSSKPAMVGYRSKSMGAAGTKASAAVKSALETKGNKVGLEHVVQM